MPLGSVVSPSASASPWGFQKPHHLFTKEETGGGAEVDSAGEWSTLQLLCLGQEAVGLRVRVFALALS